MFEARLEKATLLKKILESVKDLVRFWVAREGLRREKGRTWDREPSYLHAPPAPGRHVGGFASVRLHSRDGESAIVHEKWRGWVGERSPRSPHGRAVPVVTKALPLSSCCVAFYISRSFQLANSSPLLSLP